VCFGFEYVLFVVVVVAVNASALPNETTKDNPLLPGVPYRVHRQVQISYAKVKVRTKI